MQLQGLRLGIEPSPSGSLHQRPTELQKPLLTASARVLYLYGNGNAGEVNGYIKDNIWHLHSLLMDKG